MSEKILELADKAFKRLQDHRSKHLSYTVYKSVKEKLRDLWLLAKIYPQLKAEILLYEQTLRAEIAKKYEKADDVDKQFIALRVDIDRLTKQNEIDLTAARTLYPECNSVGDMTVVIGAKLAAQQQRIAELSQELAKYKEMEKDMISYARTYNRR